MTTENCIVDLFLGLNVKMAFAKYEKADAIAKAIVNDKIGPKSIGLNAIQYTPK
jgi:hypothetical protein